MAATDTRRRVKVYSFNENMQWEDMGTGHVSMNYVERLQSLIIMVRSEEDGKSFRSGGLLATGVAAAGAFRLARGEGRRRIQCEGQSSWGKPCRACYDV